MTNDVEKAKEALIMAVCCFAAIVIVILSLVFSK